MPKRQARKLCDSSDDETGTSSIMETDSSNCSTRYESSEESDSSSCSTQQESHKEPEDDRFVEFTIGALNVVALKENGYMNISNYPKGKKGRGFSKWTMQEAVIRERKRIRERTHMKRDEDVILITDAKKPYRGIYVHNELFSFALLWVSPESIWKMSPCSAYYNDRQETEKIKKKPISLKDCNKETLKSIRVIKSMFE